MYFSQELYGQAFYSIYSVANDHKRCDFEMTLNSFTPPVNHHYDSKIYD